MFVIDIRVLQACPVEIMAKKKTTAPANSSAVTEVTRNIDSVVTAMLWARAAGRCQFHGCNKPLWKSEVTGEKINVAQRAHIYSFSSGGPRGHKGIAKKELNNFDNLMLVCHGCHQKIDKDKDGGRYSVELLQGWKRNHEARVELVTGIAPSKKSHVILYGSSIGVQNVHLNFEDAAAALFPTRYPAADHPIELTLAGNVARDDTERFYAMEAPNLIGAFNEKLRPGIRDKRIEHASIFALAAQPLLILLGTLLNDISSAEVFEQHPDKGAEIFQRHREPEQTWEWRTKGGKLNLSVQRPSSFTDVPALVFALSDYVDDSRVTEILGKKISVWKVTVSQPSMELIKTRAQLSEFRIVIRDLLSEINRRHGLESTLHIFPVMGVSTAVELGRMRMPKAAMPWQVYDQISGRGFVPALSIPFHENA